MKKVLFVANTMNIGGVEKALLGIINKFIGEGWSVSLALIKKEGGFLKHIPKSVEIIEIKGHDSIKSIIVTSLKTQGLTFLKRGHLGKSLLFFYYYLIQKFFKSSVPLYRYIFNKIPDIQEYNDTHFDLAVAFAGPHAFIDYFVATKVHADEKWGWIHFDVSKFGNDQGIIKKCGKFYSTINVVSKEGKRIFDKMYPSLSEKTKLYHNIIDKKLILDVSKEDLPSDIVRLIKNKIVILTVGRVSCEKGQYKCLLVLKEILTKRSDVVWCFVGDGGDMSRCKRFVEDNNMEQHALFPGADSNPYRYMAACDLYVQPSLHEGFCITLGEAKLFGMPIIATDFTGAREQLRDYKKGVVTAHDSKQLSKAITEVINEHSAQIQNGRLS